jgi:hypothetical protein
MLTRLGWFALFLAVPVAADEPWSAEYRRHEFFTGRPHIWVVNNTESDYEWLLDSRNLIWLTEHRFGYATLGGKLYTHGNRPHPDHKKYIFKEPGKVKSIIGLLHNRDIKVVTWVGAWHCKQAGMTGPELLRVIEDLRDVWRVDGVYLDNGEIGRTVDETTSFFVGLRILFPRGQGVIMHHTSIQPHWGRVVHDGPWAPYTDYTVVGETNPAPVDMRDPLWEFWVQHPFGFGNYKAGTWAICKKQDPESPVCRWYNDHSWMPAAVKLCLPARLPAEWIPRYADNYFPTYFRLRQAYIAANGGGE